jgi:hypothetical protein
MTLDVYGHAIANADRKAAELVADVLRAAMNDADLPRAGPRRRRR